MATGLSVANANSFLDWLFNGTAMPAAPAGCWIQLHTGDPGAAGTANIAGNATREDLRAAMANAASGTITSDAQIAWSTAEVDTAEDYTHWTAWSANAAGTFLCSGVMTANAVQIGDEFVIPVGDFDAALAVAA